MPPLSGESLMMLLIVASGSGLFLRMVAKEKHRRERYLQWRLEEKMRELESGVSPGGRTGEEKQEAGPPVVAEPVEEDAAAQA